MTGTSTAELAYRENDGLEVSLLWSKSCRRLTVVVSDWRAAHSFELTAHPENALDVFHHPYAYAALQGII